MAAIQAHRRAITAGVPTIVYDTATTAYMSAAGVPNTSAAYYTGTGYATTGTAMWNAADALIVGLKSNGLWARIILLYPMLGGTASSHFINAKTPGSRTITPGANNPTHNAQGIRFNGVNQTANTQYAVSNMPTGQGYALDYYSADNTTITTGDPVEIGGGAPTLNYLLLVAKNTSGFAAGRASNGGSAITSDSAVSNSAGLFTMDRNAAGAGMLYRNAVALLTTPVTLSAVPNDATGAISLGALSDGYGFSNRGCSLACVRGSFTAAEMTTYYNLVQAFQTANFRAV